MVIVINIVSLIQDSNQHSPIIFKAESLKQQLCSENRAEVTFTMKKSEVL